MSDVGGILAHLLCDRVVDDHGLAADLGSIVGLGELGGHVQPEVAVPLHFLVPQLYSLAPGSLQVAAPAFELFLEALPRKACV